MSTPCARLSAALDLTGATRDALLASARAPAHDAAVDELTGVSLPLPLTALLGRDADMQTLRHGLRSRRAPHHAHRARGVGKTRLALELARAIAAEGATRVVFVPLAAIRDPAFVASAIAEALGLADVTGASICRGARASACDGQPTLLVLDNFEQVLDAAPLVADLLTRSHALRLLATSRAPLRVRGEREYPSDRSRWMWAQRRCRRPTWHASPAVRLFVERVRDVQPDFRLTPANGADRDRDLPPARCAAARARARGAVDQSADGRGSAPPARARRPALDRRPARSSRTPADDECDRRLELSTARRRTSSAPSAASARCPACFRSTRPRRSLPAVRMSPAAMRRSAPRGGRPDRQEPSAASRDVGRCRRARSTTCSKPCGRTPRSSSPRRASATTPWRGWCATARVKPPSPRRGWSDPRRSSGWIACVKISRATAAP